MRIQNKFLVPSMGLTLLSLAVFGSLYLTDVRQQERQRFDQKVTLTNELLAQGSRELLSNQDQVGVQALCEQVVADPEVLGVRIADSSGVVDVRLPEGEASSASESAVERNLEVTHAGKIVGNVVVTYSRAQLERRNQRVGLLFAGLVAALVGGLLATYWIVVKSVAKPIEAIVKAMKDVNAGDYRARLDLRADDEFGEVETCFNAMVEGVKEGHLRDTQSHAKQQEQAKLLANEIDEHKQTEEALWQAQKMTALARLSGGVAHDFNNLLTSILGFSSMAQDQLDKNDQAYEDIQEVIHAGEKARDLTQHLLALGRKRELEMCPLDINTILTGLDSLLRRTLGADIELVTVLDESKGSVIADGIALQQVIVNLALNARDAMPRGGKLTISTKEVFLEKADLADLPDINVGSYARISVQDTGVGMSDDVKTHIFEPFFTTKKEGESAGLGLSTVHGIIRQCKGAIAFDSEQGRGSEFCIYLPLEGVEVGVEAAAIPAVEEVVGGTETVLLVEDEDSVRRLTYRILKRLGYNVLLARYGTEGVQVAKEYQESIDLILSDVVMPHMSGPDMVKEIAKVRNDYRVLYMSGFTQDRIASTDESGQPVNLVLKPFTRQVLARRVRDVLDEDPLA